MKLSISIVLVLAPLVFPSCFTTGVSSETAAHVEAEVRALLTAQQDDWNAGDLDGFLSGYDPTPSLAFISGAQIHRGFAETRARFHQRYGSRDAMGTLTFDELEVLVLSNDAAVATGAFRLDRHEDAPHGRFTLALRKRDGAWRIILDHTSTPEG